MTETEQGCAAAPPSRLRPRGMEGDGWRWRLHRVLDARDRGGRVMALFGGPLYGGSPSIPGTTAALDVPMKGGTDPRDVKVYRVLDDGFSVYAGYPDQWKWSMDRDEAHRFARWVLWTWWAKGEWFGLRRRAYYAGLRAHVNGFRGLPR